MSTKEHRRPIPLGVKLHACLLLLGHPEHLIKPKRKAGIVMQAHINTLLLQLGFTKAEIDGGDIQWDHYPALALRPIVDGVMQPAPNDPHYIRPMRKADHRVKTSGTKATSAGSDTHLAAKVKRLAGERPPRRKPKIQSRPFQKRKKERRK